jgi:hypothetical protein
MEMDKRASLTKQSIRNLRSSRPDVAAFGDAETSDGASTAVLVVHGMGQQLVFQTLDDVVWGLHREHERRTGQGPEEHPSSVGLIRPIDRDGKPLDTVVPRATLSVRDSAGDDLDVDFYECYWASLTQGAVGIKAVMGFLLDGGRNGLRNAGRAFERTMFGRSVELGHEKWTALWLLVALAVILALLFFNVAISLVIGVKLLGEAASEWMGAGFIHDASMTALLTVGAMLVSLAVMWFLWRSLWCFYAALLALLGGAVWLGWSFLHHKLGWPAPPLPGWALQGWMIVGMWIVLLLGSWYARHLIVQYVGDVAAYVQPHKLGKFGALRAAIKAEARGIAEVVYNMKKPNGEPKYDRIAIVGHSLGSVVAYDLLNEMLVRDIADGEPRKVCERTPLFLTFGSPLDKIAFLFKGQGSRTGTTRENLAAARQPLILDYAYRKRLSWINIYSKKDIISGSLDFFDDPEDAANAHLRIENLEDSLCKIPLNAHIEYWDNQLVFEKLYDALIAPPPLPATKATT